MWGAVQAEAAGASLLLNICTFLLHTVALSHHIFHEHSRTLCERKDCSMSPVLLPPVRCPHKVLVAVRSFDPARLRPQSCAFHPKGTLLAVAFSSGACKILEASDLEEVAGFRYTTTDLTGIRFSPDGEMVRRGRRRALSIVVVVADPTMVPGNIPQADCPPNMLPGS